MSIAGNIHHRTGQQKFSGKMMKKLQMIWIILISMSLVACSGEADVSVTEVSEDTYNTALNVTDIMNMILEPASDSLWKSGGWVLSDAGYEELYPSTPEGWELVRKQAAVIVEVGNSLLIPGRPYNDDAWVIYSQGLSDAGIQAMAAAAAQNKEDFFQAGADLYSVCTACHQAYNPEINSRFTQNSPLQND